MEAKASADMSSLSPEEMSQLLSPDWEEACVRWAANLENFTQVSPYAEYQHLDTRFPGNLAVSAPQIQAEPLDLELGDSLERGVPLSNCHAGVYISPLAGTELPLSNFFPGQECSFGQPTPQSIANMSSPMQMFSLPISPELTLDTLVFNTSTSPEVLLGTPMSLSNTGLASPPPMFNTPIFPGVTLGTPTPLSNTNLASPTTGFDPKIEVYLSEENNFHFHGFLSPSGSFDSGIGDLPAQPSRVVPATPWDEVQRDILPGIVLQNSSASKPAPRKNKPPSLCPCCPKSFGEKRRLHFHIQSDHSDYAKDHRIPDQRVKCSKCEMLCRPDNVLRHMEQVHSLTIPRRRKQRVVKAKPR